MARGLFITGFTISEVLAIQQRAKDLLLEGKTIMNWNDADTSTAKQFTMPVDQVLEECGHRTGRHLSLPHQPRGRRILLITNIGGCGSWAPSLGKPGGGVSF